MSLVELFGLVVAGIAGIVLLVHVTGGSRARVFDTAEEAIAQWEFDHPGAPVSRAHVASSGRAALIESAQGDGLIWSFGADAVSRLLVPAALTRIAPHPRGLRVQFDDFNAPAAVLDLTETEAATWAAWLGRFERK